MRQGLEDHDPDQERCTATGSRSQFLQLRRGDVNRGLAGAARAQTLAITIDLCPSGGQRSTPSAPRHRTDLSASQESKETANTRQPQAAPLKTPSEGRTARCLAADFPPPDCSLSGLATPVPRPRPRRVPSDRVQTIAENDHLSICRLRSPYACFETGLQSRQARRFGGKLTIEGIGDDSECGFGVEGVGFPGGEWRTGQTF